MDGLIPFAKLKEKAGFDAKLSDFTGVMSDAERAAVRSSIDALGNDKWELIQTIVLGYSLTLEEPADWAENYTSYYINSGTAKEQNFTAVTGETAPTWQAATYYSFESSTPVHFHLTHEPDGTPYHFRKLWCFIQNTNPQLNTYKGILSTADLRSVGGGQYQYLRNSFSVFTGRVFKLITDVSGKSVWKEFELGGEWEVANSVRTANINTKQLVHPYADWGTLADNLKYINSVKSNDGYHGWLPNSQVTVYAVR